MGRGQRRKLLGKAWLLHCQMTQDIDKEGLLVGVVTVESLLRGNTRLGQNGIDACCQVALLKKQPMGGCAQPLACLLCTAVRLVFHRCVPIIVTYSTLRL